MSLAESLRELELLRYRWVDLANVVRAKGLVLPTIRERLFAGGVGHWSHEEPGGPAQTAEEHLRELLATSVTISQAQFSLPVTADVVTPAADLPPTHDLTLVPDLGSLVPLPYAPGQAAVACDVLDHGEPSPLCLRSFVRRVVDRAAQSGLRPRVGVELEFALLRASDGGHPQPADSSTYAAENAFDVHEEFLAEVLAVLGSQRVSVAQIHPESAPGQFEISLWHLDPVAAADAVISARQTIKAVAGRHGMIASFLPVVDPGSGGSGMHLHLSLTGDADDGLADAERPFIGGVLESLPALLAITAPTPMSYERFRPHFWAGAYSGWGYENKEMPLRVTRNADGRSRDVEYKAIDATANPYLAIGALLAVGLDGITRQVAPPPAVVGDPGLLDEQERAAAGIVPLPESPAAPLAALADHDSLRRALGEDLHHAYLAVKRSESAELEQMDPTSRRNLLLARY